MNSSPPNGQSPKANPANFHRPHGRPTAVENAVVPHSIFREGRFGRMFRTLDPYIPPGRTDREREELLGQLAGTMLETQGEANDPAFDNAAIPSGYTYFGQFIDHDITFDPVSSLQRQNDPNQLENFRTARFDLDCLYGEGPDDEPFIYDRKDPTKFLIGKGRKIDGAPPNQTPGAPSDEDDLPRNEQFSALIGDPRNDENLIVAQIQLAFLKFHNKLVDEIRAKDVELAADSSALFREAQRQVRWHYQWVVLHDFLRRIIGEELYKKVVPTPQDPDGSLRFYKPKNYAFLPVEFSVAAYRMGHSMIRTDYILNNVLDGFRQGKRVPIFLPGQVGPLDDARGLRPLPAFWSLQWEHFLDAGTIKPQMSRLLNAKLAHALGAIPAGPGGQNPLAFLNLRRGWRLGLPSGQRVARAMWQKPLSNKELGLDPKVYGYEAPLWFYILKEAELKTGGKHLGPVGGRICAEVFVGLALHDKSSYLSQYPLWEPTLPKQGARFELRDIFKFAGVPFSEKDLPFKAPPAPPGQ